MGQAPSSKELGHDVAWNGMHSLYKHGSTRQRTINVNGSPTQAALGAYIYQQGTNIYGYNDAGKRIDLSGGDASDKLKQVKNAGLGPTVLLRRTGGRNRSYLFIKSRDPGQTVSRLQEFHNGKEFYKLVHGDRTDDSFTRESGQAIIDPFHAKLSQDFGDKLGQLGGLVRDVAASFTGDLATSLLDVLTEGIGGTLLSESGLSDKITEAFQSSAETPQAKMANALVERVSVGKANKQDIENLYWLSNGNELGFDPSTLSLTQKVDKHTVHYLQDITQLGGETNQSFLDDPELERVRQQLTNQAQTLVHNGVGNQTLLRALAGGPVSDVIPLLQQGLEVSAMDESVSKLSSHVQGWDSDELTRLQGQLEGSTNFKEKQRLFQQYNTAILSENRKRVFKSQKIALMDDIKSKIDLAEQRGMPSGALVNAYASLRAKNENNDESTDLAQESSVLHQFNTHLNQMLADKRQQVEDQVKSSDIRRTYHRVRGKYGAREQKILGPSADQDAYSQETGGMLEKEVNRIPEDQARKIKGAVPQVASQHLKNVLMEAHLDNMHEK